MIRWYALPLLGVLAAGPQGGSAPVFRTGTDAVALDVAVFDGRRVVSGLGLDDFEVFDNGVRQSLTSVDRNVLPIDLRLVFDTSGSISESDLEDYLTAMREVAAVLGPDDRCEIITFNSRIADAASRQGPPVTIAIQRGGPDGTAFFDAASLAMVTLPTLDRRQVTILLSDARDNASFFDEAALLDTARRTDAVVYSIMPTHPNQDMSASMARLQAVAVLTGGRLIHAAHARHIGSTVIGAIEEFRQSYVVRYSLAGVQVKGWHALEIKVRGRSGLKVRTKAGFFAR